MELSGEHRIPAQREQVFAALCDETVLMRCISPLEAMERVAADRYLARVGISLGPFRARFEGRVEVAPIDPPGFYVLNGEGTGLLGFARGVVEIRLGDINGHTLLSYRLTAEIGGRVGQMAGKLVRSKAESHIARFFDRFVEAMRAGTSPRLAWEGPESLRRT